MMDNQEAAALLIKNIGMFEQATLLLDEVEVNINKKVKEKIENWVSKAEWSYDDNSDGDYFMHEPCATNSEGNWIGYFGITPQGEVEDNRWLTSYCGEGKCRYGISFSIDPDSLGVNKSVLRKYLQRENVNYPKLREIGFEFYGTKAGWWFIPFQLDANNLATSYAGGVIEDALQPIEDVLNKVKDALPEFERLLDATLKEFTSSTPV